MYRYDGYFNLQCKRPNTIQIVNASSRQCRNESICCKSPTDDTVEESGIDMQELRSRYDRQQKCEVSILKKNTGGESTDYESVKYICRKSGKLIFHLKRLPQMVQPIVNPVHLCPNV